MNVDKDGSQNSKLPLIFFQDIITIAISLNSKRKQGTHVRKLVITERIMPLLVKIWSLSKDRILGGKVMLCKTIGEKVL